MYHGQHSFIVFCKIDFIPENYQNYYSLTVYTTAIYDIIFSISSFIAFINPIKQMIKSLLSTGDHNETIIQMKREITKLMHLGVRYAVLCFIITFTTILSVAAIAIKLSECIPIGWIVNMLCLILMTRYYTNGRLYENLCCCVINCGYCCMGCCCNYNQHTMEMVEMVERNSRRISMARGIERQRINTTTATIQLRSVTPTITVNTDNYIPDNSPIMDVTKESMETPTVNKMDYNMEIDIVEIPTDKYMDKNTLRSDTAEIIMGNSSPPSIKPRRSVLGFVIAEEIKLNQTVEESDDDIDPDLDDIDMGIVESSAESANNDDDPVSDGFSEKP